MPLKSSRGVVLSVVVISMLMTTLIAGYALVISYEINAVLVGATGKRIVSYYRAQAGTVDALWRIKNDYANISGFQPPGTFTNPNYDPYPYCLDIDTNPPTIVAVAAGANPDCTPGQNFCSNNPNWKVCVDIGIDGGNGLRNIEVTGRDTLS